MSALRRKLIRDLRTMLGQGITIALVIAAGISGFITLRSTWQSLVDSRDAYYERYRFGDAFVSLERAPDRIRNRLEAVPGVAMAYARVTEPVRILMEGLAQPPIGQVVSLPSSGQPPLNDLLLQEGRFPNPGDAEEAILLESFSERWEIGLGDTIRVVMEGNLRSVRVVGVGASPEFVFPVSPAAELIPDDDRFAVLWMDREAIAPAFQMENSFNGVVFRLDRNASLREVQDRVDALLEPYGGLGLVGRDLQPSNYILNGELQQLGQFAMVLPMIFLGVAAFLLNLVLSRTLKLQRTQIATLKAVGYRDLEIGVHYLQMASGIVLTGAALGLALGWWMGSGMTNLYGNYFGFPALEFRVRVMDMAISAGIAIGAGFLGAGLSLWQVLRLAPAEAMRSEPPAHYRPTILESLGVGRLVGPSGRMVVREIGRRPLRPALSSLGIAMAVGLLVVGRWSGDALDFLIDHQFYRAWREDVTVGFTGPVTERGIRELLQFPGVTRAEGLRVTAARIRSGHLWRDAAIQGYPMDSQLRQLVDDRGQVSRLPEGGFVITRKLAELLHVSPGDSVRIELREGRSREHRIQITGLVDEMFGLQGHMALTDLNRLLGEGPRVSQALLSTERGSFGELELRLAGVPAVGNVTRRDAIIQRFREQSADLLIIMMLIISAFAAVIAAGVVYNNARVALSVRARDLAVLRVQGFTRREISSILLGELAVQVLLAIPLGLLIGYWLSAGIASTVDPERYRLPVVLTPWTFGYAALVVIVAGVVSALFVRRKLDHLDLIAVLKSSE